MKNGVVYETNVDLETDLHSLLNDGGPFLLLKNRGSINKYEISHTFKSGENPILEGISKHPLREQELLWGVIKHKKSLGYPIRSYDSLINAYKRMRDERKLDLYSSNPLSFESWSNTDLSLNNNNND